MLQSPYFRRLFLPYLILICLAIGAVGAVGVWRLRTAYRNQAEGALRDQSVLVARLIQDDLSTAHTENLQRQIRQIGAQIGCRITVVQADGQVIADNEADPSRMDNHRLRPEIVAAASLGEGSNIRASDTLHQDLLYFARRIDRDGQPVFLRLAVHLAELNRHLQTFYAGLTAATLLAIAVTAAICFLFARRHARPLVELTTLAQRLAQGELNRRVLVKEQDEMGALAGALNAMAESLSRLLVQSEKDRAELLTMLQSMSEGVIATDAQQRIRLINPAAVALLALESREMQGRLLWEAVRQEAILKAAEEVLASRQGRTFPIGPLAGRHLSVTVQTFPPHLPPLGLVVVIHDVTQQVRYQELRKEFVANVSHELRTPLTAIKGFAETLRDGALHDSVRAPQYLATIEKHADQLTNLVADLLALSRLESQPDLPPQGPVDLAALVHRTADLLQPVAAKKRQALQVQAPPNLAGVIGNVDYLERAVTNLLDNAIKYTPEGGRISVRVTTEQETAVVEVSDTGIGIPADDLPRIFERFYRVDRSRSREMGGTGLGLAIVKHVAQVHHGSVEVASTPGHGSTFRLKLPLAQ